MSKSQYDVAIAHKDYDVAGGGELVAERMGVAMDAPVYAGFVTDTNRPDHIGADVRGLWDDGIINSILQRGGLPRALAYRYLWSRVPDLHEYDVVIQSGNEPLWYVPPEDQVTVAYTHSTPRLMYDLDTKLPVHEQARDDDSGGLLGAVGTLVDRGFSDLQRLQYRHVTDYPDLYVANSERVAQRIRKYWSVDEDRIRVVYPPVDVAGYGPRHADRDGDFYLSVNRLAPWKGLGEIVDAFAQLDERLVIAGKGPEREALEARADGADNIEFAGYVSEPEKRRLLAEAKATVYNPLNEDFGMVPIESLASGTPVVSVNDGNQQHQLVDGETAVLFERRYDRPATTVRNLRHAVRRFDDESVALDAEGLQQAVHYYRVERFEQELRAAVDAAVERHRVGVPKWQRHGEAVGDEARVTVEPLPDGGDADE